MTDEVQGGQVIQALERVFVKAAQFYALELKRDERVEPGKSPEKERKNKYGT